MFSKTKVCTTYVMWKWTYHFYATINAIPMMYKLILYVFVNMNTIFFMWRLTLYVLKADTMFLYYNRHYKLYVEMDAWCFMWRWTLYFECGNVLIRMGILFLCETGHYDLVKMGTIFLYENKHYNFVCGNSQTIFNVGTDYIYIYIYVLCV
jgi:hypothetical protein